MPTYSRSFSLNPCYQPHPIVTWHIHHRYTWRTSTLMLYKTRVTPTCNDYFNIDCFTDKKMMTTSWVILDRTNQLKAWWLKRSCSNKRVDRCQPSLPLARGKTIKNESTFPHSFLLLVSFAVKFVTVYALKGRQRHAVCTLQLSRLEDLYCRDKNHLLSVLSKSTEVKKLLWFHPQNPTGLCKLLHSSVNQYSSAGGSC